MKLKEQRIKRKSEKRLRNECKLKKKTTERTNKYDILQVRIFKQTGTWAHARRSTHTLCKTCINEKYKLKRKIENYK